MTRPAAFPLFWPSSIPRTAMRMRPREGIGMSAAVWALHDSLSLFGRESGCPVTEVVISSNVCIGTPRPKDPGVALYFQWDGAQRCIAVDRYRLPEANVRAVYHVIEARRAELRDCGLEVVRASFLGAAALPPPMDWRDVLGLDAGPVSDIAAVERAFKERARSAHPDMTGGSNAEMVRLLAAREQARRELSE